MIRRACIVSLLTLSGATAANADDALGRLFFTPEQRAALDRARSHNQRQTQQLEATDLSLQGIVRRSSGRNTVWINGRPHDVADPGELNVSVGDDPVSARIVVGDDAPARLRVGESINRGTREKRDALGRGEIVVRRAPASP